MRDRMAEHRRDEGCERASHSGAQTGQLTQSRSISMQPPHERDSAGGQAGAFHAHSGIANGVSFPLR